MDEKWAFVGKKEANCDPEDPADRQCGDSWDHVALDPEHRLVLAVVAGKRTAENTQKLVDEVKTRLGGRVPRLITTDEYPAYEGAILKAFGQTITPPRTGKPGRPMAPYQVAPEALHYAVVHKTREKGRVIQVAVRVIFGVLAAVMEAVAASRVSRAINTAFIERHNGTDRHHNARKRRKTYCFSKDWAAHEAMTYFTMYSYNFCWPVRTLREKVDGRWRPRTPAMAAGLAEHVWSMREWLSFPTVQPT
jgi:IS1 family transposase